MVLILVIALLARVAFVLTLDPHQLYWPDEKVYDAIAQSLAQGHGFAADAAWMAGHADASQGAAYFATPLWPMFLALLYAVFGHNLVVARLAGALIGALTCAVTYATTARLFDRRVAFWSGLVLALYPAVIYLAGVLYIENFFALWLAISTYALVRFVEQPSWKRAAVAGVCLGLTALSRSVALALVPVVALVPLLDRESTWRRRFGFVAVLWLAATATIAPWTIRNWCAYDHFLPISSGSGLTLWRGNCEFSRGDTGDRFLGPFGDSWHQRDDSPAAHAHITELRQRLAGLDEIEVDRVLGNEARRFMREHPWHCAKLYAKKWLGLHSAFTAVLPTNDRASARDRFVIMATTYPVLLLGLCGLVLHARRWRELRVLYLVWAVFALGLPVLTTCTRFRLPVDPLLIMFAVATVLKFKERLAESDRAAARLGIIIAAGVGLRLAWCLLAPAEFYWRDEVEYDTVARNLLDHGIYSRDGVHPTAYRAPGQPLFLAAIYSLDYGSIAATRVWQTLLWGVAIWLVYRVARGLGASERASLWAAAAAAVYPYYIYAAGTLFPLTLFTVAVLAATWGLLAVYDGGGWRAAMLAGGALGVGALTIPYLLLSVFIVPCWLGRHRARQSLLVVATALLVIAPWPLRNWAAFGSPIMGTQQWLNVWYGNNPQATASSGSNIRIAPHETLWVPYRDTQATNELAADNILRNDALRYVREHPAETARLWVAKAFNFFRLWPNTQTQNAHTSLASKLAGALTFGPVLLLGLIGWWCGGLDRRRAMIVAIYFATFVAVSAVTISKDRFRMPLDVYLMVFAAAAVERWISSCKRPPPPDNSRTC